MRGQAILSKLLIHSEAKFSSQDLFEVSWSAHQDKSPYSRETLANWIESPKTMALYAELGGELLGFILSRSILDEADILLVAVKKDWQGQGLASRLMEKANLAWKDAGLSRVFLEVRSKNSPALALYQKAGFKEIGHRQRYYKNPPDDAIEMLLTLERNA